MRSETIYLVGLFTDRLYALWVAVYSPTTGAGLSMKAALAQLALESRSPMLRVRSSKTVGLRIWARGQWQDC